MERMTKQTPTIRKEVRSFRSRSASLSSTDIRHSKVAPEMTSMKLSMPKPTREMLPARAPANMATRPSRVFHPMVKYSSRLPCQAENSRCESAASCMRTCYQAHLRQRADLRAGGVDFNCSAVVQPPTCFFHRGG